MPPKTNSLDKWRCRVCQFDNLMIIPSCEICQSTNEHSEIKMNPNSDKEDDPAVIFCPQASCKQPNSIVNDHCHKCAKPLFPEQDDYDGLLPPKEQEELTKCKYCDYQNNIENDFCLNCDRKIRVRRIRGKTVPAKRAPRATKSKKSGHTVPCPTCDEQLRIIDYMTKQADICMKCQEKKPIQMDSRTCIFCDRQLSKIESKDHDKTCPDRKIFFQRKQSKTFDRCTDLQYQTMVYMHKKCQILHHRRQKLLNDRIRKLGYSEKDLSNLHHYIIHYAPIIIHMHVNTHFHFFLKDTHYRNQFQTSISSGSLSHSARTSWEDRMFDKRHHSATGYQRVKYGTMNFTNDPSGVMACLSYGQSYFLLKSHVRDRCTITDMDSSSPSSTLGTFRFIFHLLMKLSDAELRSAFEGSKGKQMLSNVIGAYKQIQIHGPVEFSKDIERVYISKQELKLGDAKSLLEQVKSFCSKHNIEYELVDTVRPSPLAFGVAGPIIQKDAPSRIVGDKKQLTEQDLKPIPVAVPMAPSIFSFGLPMPAVLGVSYHLPGRMTIPPKKKEYGVDYI